MIRPCLVITVPLTNRMLALMWDLEGVVIAFISQQATLAEPVKREVLKALSMDHSFEPNGIRQEKIDTRLTFLRADGT
jgi:hypothetical protein